MPFLNSHNKDNLISILHSIIAYYKTRKAFKYEKKKK